MQDVTSEFLPDGSTLNPFYNKPLGVTPPAGETWPGDPDYLEDKFVTFSYRFKFNDGEYSIMAPFTQEAFISLYLWFIVLVNFLNASGIIGNSDHFLLAGLYVSCLPV